MAEHGSAVAHGGIGARLLRKEDARFLTGRGCFVDDVVRPRMLHAAIVRSPFPRARITGIDVSEALAHPGVTAVFSGADLNAGAHATWSTVFGPDAPRPPRPPLAHDIVKFAGDPVAVVVAENRYIAEDASELVIVDYEPLVPILDRVAALADDSELVHPELGTNLASSITDPDDAELDAILAAAPHVITETFHQHRYNPMPMETNGIIAEWNPADAQLTVWIAMQNPQEARAFIARLVDLPENRVRVVMGDLGGSFGGKGGVTREEMAVILASMKMGASIKWIEDRNEHLLAAHHARAEQMTVTIGVDDEGRLLGAKLDHVDEVGAYPVGGTGSNAGNVRRMFPGPYRLPRMHFTNRAAYVNKTGRGASRGSWMLETISREVLLDVAARRLGIDPVEIRQRNVITRSELPYTTASDSVYDSVSPEETLDQAVAMIDYDAFRKEQADARNHGRYLGLGIGLFVEPTALVATILATEAATLRMDKSGSLTLLMGTASHGQSLETTMAQVVAEHLGVDPAAVTYVQGDTAVVPIGGGTGGSRSAVIGGMAAREAALRMREKVVAIAAHLLEASPDDIVIEGGTIFVAGLPSRTLTMGDIATAAFVRPATDLPAGMEAGLEVTARYTSPSITFSNACHICTCEVDVVTGMVTVLRYVVSEDCGVVINPTVVEGQICGGVVQGVGGVFYEHMVHDDEGNPLTTTFLDYLIPTTTEAPIVEFGHVETPSFHPSGMKGMGEGGTIGAPAALINAVADALEPFGIDPLTVQPLTPTRILDLLDDAKA